ncbi:MAG: amidase [Acidimicrobiia bacterium]
MSRSIRPAYHCLFPDDGCLTLMLHSLVFMSAVELASAIRSGENTAVEVVEAHLSRIAAVNPRLNAVVQLDSERAIAEAHSIDRRLNRHESVGALAGVPFTVKDWIDTEGLPCTGGDVRYRDRVPVQDATAVARLRKAGAILLGKTNVLTDNPVYGRTDNPYRVGFSPAGSSSGEAAIIAAGGSPMGLGSDSGGSIRQPAHCCGIAGLKPTTGRVPLTGHFPAISPMADPRTVIGPLARSVKDLAAVLGVIGGSDGSDPSAVPVPLGEWEAVRPERLRVATYNAHEGATPHADVVDVTEQAASELVASGLEVEERVPPRIADALLITEDYWARPESESLEEWQPDGSSRLSGQDVERHLFEWDRFRRVMLGFMQHFDVILTPAAELAARPHGNSAGGIPYTLPYSLTGYPAVVVRAGSTAEGMPIGVQVVARPWRDDVALAVAAIIEDAMGGWQPPNLDRG